MDAIGSGMVCLTRMRLPLDFTTTSCTSIRSQMETAATLDSGATCSLSRTADPQLIGEVPASTQPVKPGGGTFERFGVRTGETFNPFWTYSFQAAHPDRNFPPEPTRARPAFLNQAERLILSWHRVRVGFKGLSS